MNNRYSTWMIISLSFASSCAFASNLLPGGILTSVPSYNYGSPAYPAGYPNGVSSSGANSLLQEGSSWTVAGARGASANITFENGVYADPATGELDFFYQIQNTYPNGATSSNTVSSTIVLNESLEGVTITGVDEITSVNFESFYGFVKPTAGDRIASVSLGQYQTNGSADLTVTFSAPIAPKQDSAILVIQTDARDFDQAGEGSFSWRAAPPAGAHEGGNPARNPFVLDALEPLPTPEPGFYGVLSLAISGLMLVVHRPRKISLKRAYVRVWSRVYRAFRLPDASGEPAAISLPRM